MCEASLRKLHDIDVAQFLQLTEAQKDAIAQLRSDFLARCAVVPCSMRRHCEHAQSPVPIQMLF